MKKHTLQTIGVIALCLGLIVMAYVCLKTLLSPLDAGRVKEAFERMQAIPGAAVLAMSAASLVIVLGVKWVDWINGKNKHHHA